MSRFFVVVVVLAAALGMIGCTSVPQRPDTSKWPLPEQPKVSSEVMKALSDKRMEGLPVCVRKEVTYYDASTVAEMNKNRVVVFTREFPVLKNPPAIAVEDARGVLLAAEKKLVDKGFKVVAESDACLTVRFDFAEYRNKEGTLVSLLARTRTSYGGHELAISRDVGAKWEGGATSKGPTLSDAIVYVALRAVDEILQVWGHLQEKLTATTEK